MLKNEYICQDRLGTNIRKVEKRDTCLQAMHQDIKEKSAAGAGSMDAWAQMLEDTGGDPPEKAATLVLGTKNVRFCAVSYVSFNNNRSFAQDRLGTHMGKAEEIKCRFMQTLLNQR